MYITGIMNKPDSFKAFSTYEEGEAYWKRMLQDNPHAYILSAHIPGDIVFGCGIVNKPDTLCLFTTKEEADKQAMKFRKFYSPREVFDLTFRT